MSETFRPLSRASIVLGSIGAVALGLMLAFSVLFVAGMSHCSRCNLTPFMLRGFAVSLLFALLFGCAVGLGAAGLRPRLRPYLGARGTDALLVLLILGLAAASVPVGFSGILSLEYRLDKAKEDAALAKLRDPCPDRPQHLSIIHDGLPRPLPRDTFVAEVRFEETEVGMLHTSGARARVIRVIQGDPTVERLSVERLQSHRCDEAFENGARGLVVAIPKDRARAGYQKVEAIFARRGDGYRLPDGFQIQEWQRPYWLPKPPAAQAQNGVAGTSVESGNAVVVAAPPTVIEARGPLER